MSVKPLSGWNRYGLKEAATETNQVFDEASFTQERRSSGSWASVVKGFTRALFDAKSAQIRR
jgi:hypothetical protein